VRWDGLVQGRKKGRDVVHAHVVVKLHVVPRSLACVIPCTREGRAWHVPHSVVPEQGRVFKAGLQKLGHVSLQHAESGLPDLFRRRIKVNVECGIKLKPGRPVERKHGCSGPHPVPGGLVDGERG
jgi:hypothetical protein